MTDHSKYLCSHVDVVMLSAGTTTSRGETRSVTRSGTTIITWLRHDFTSGIIMILQLNPSILVETPLGRGQALFIIDYGMHQNTCWVVTLESNGIIKHFDCNDIILSTNYTYGLNLRHNTNHPPEPNTEVPNINTQTQN